MFMSLYGEMLVEIKIHNSLLIYLYQQRLSNGPVFLSHVDGTGAFLPQTTI